LTLAPGGKWVRPFSPTKTIDRRTAVNFYANGLISRFETLVQTRQLASRPLRHGLLTRSLAVVAVDKLIEPVTTVICDCSWYVRPTHSFTQACSLWRGAVSTNVKTVGRNCL